MIYIIIGSYLLRHGTSLHTVSSKTFKKTVKVIGITVGKNTSTLSVWVTNDVGAI